MGHGGGLLALGMHLINFKDNPSFVRLVLLLNLVNLRVFFFVCLFFRLSDPSGHEEIR